MADLLTISEVQNLLNIKTPGTVIAMIRRGTLQGFQLDNGYWRVRRESVEKLVTP